MSHPFIERLIGTIRREYLDQVPFWNSLDLERKLGEFRENQKVTLSQACDTSQEGAETTGEVKSS